MEDKNKTGIAINTDVEIFREDPEDNYSSSAHVTKNKKLGINVGGLVIVKALSEWHNLASESRIRDIRKMTKES